MKITKELKAGAIAIVSIISFVFLFQFMKGKNLFSSDNIYYAKFSNVDGLAASSKVSINGLKVGQVSKIIPVTDSKGRINFVLEMLVKKDFKFSKNSTVEIFEPGLMSGKEARINLIYNENWAKDGDTLKSSYKESIMANLTSQVGPVKDKLQAVLSKVDSLMANANAITNEKNQEQFKLLLGSLNRTIASFESTSQQTNRLLANNDPRVQQVLDNANLATISAKSTIDKYGKVAEQVDVQKLNNAIEKLNQTSDKLNIAITGINNGEGSLGKLTKDEELYKNLNQSAKNLNKLIEDIKANPKRYLNISVFGKSGK